MTKVTDRSGVVQAHDGSRSFLDAIVEHIPAVVVVKDAAELRFVRVNRAGQELLGFTNDELMGKSDEDLLAPHDAIARMTADREVLRAGTLVDLPAEAVVGPDGTTRILHTRKIPVMGDDGQPRFLLAISEDVTEWEVSTQEQEKLFTPFERLGADGSEIEGTGLGLVRSQRLVEAMGGTLTVESEPGAGSTFWFDLESCGEVTVELPPGMQPPPAVVSQPTCRVLYIEDNLGNVLLVERLLEHRPNVELIVAMHGQLGLDLAFEHQPDLLLVDINLPDLSGHTILRRLRADARTSATPIVVVSADATSSQIAACKAAGADDYLTKPFDIPAFFAVVDEFLAGTATSADPFATRSDTCPEEFEPTVLALLRRINDHEGSIDLIDAYERESRSQLRRLIQASAGGDTAGAQGLAHSMRGATGTIGAVHLAALLGRLEAAIGAGSDDVGALVVAVSTELDRAVSVLRQLFAAA